jgi:hypothetical protein
MVPSGLPLTLEVDPEDGVLPESTDGATGTKEGEALFVQ